MADSKEHYRRVLSPVYSWMLGGFDAAVERNATFFDEQSILAPVGSGFAVDLGAGCGFQSIPLAERGFRVVAIDLDKGLLEELERHAGELPIDPIEADLLRFKEFVPEGLELAICMTDTLLHLGSKSDIETLLNDVFEALEPGGRLVLTFRDLSSELTELERFIPVKSEAMRLMMCFLEYEPETVKVHDLVYDKRGDEWQLGKSYYRKLRLAPGWVNEALLRAGFAAIDSSETGGLVTVVASK